MATLVADGIWVGNQKDCNGKEFLTVLHATKAPCWDRQAKMFAGPIIAGPSVVVTGSELFFKIIDADKVTTRVSDFLFAVKWLDRAARPVLVHCNQGGSRAPAIVFVYLARYGLLDAYGEVRAYGDALDLFQQLYPAFHPGPGIERYLKDHWGELVLSDLD